MNTRKLVNSAHKDAGSNPVSSPLLIKTQYMKKGTIVVFKEECRGQFEGWKGFIPAMSIPEIGKEYESAGVNTMCVNEKYIDIHGLRAPIGYPAKWWTVKEPMSNHTAESILEEMEQVELV